jgi:hypothetical protein
MTLHVQVGKREVGTGGVPDWLVQQQRLRR